jgi:hypothetical protein
MICKTQKRLHTGITLFDILHSYDYTPKDDLLQSTLTQPEPTTSPLICAEINNIPQCIQMTSNH